MNGYVAAWAFGTTTACGALLLVLILDATRARWFAPMRHAAQSVAAALPLFAILLVPIALDARALYPTASDVARPWMHPAPLVVRTLLALALWTGFAEGIARAEPSRRARIAAVGIPLVGFTLSMVAFDWLMPLAHGFTSDLYGLYVSAGAFEAAVGLTALLAARGARGQDAMCFHALARVMLVSVSLWAYLAFFLFLLVWITDLPREAGFFLARGRGGWAAVSAALALGRFVVPFALLLSRGFKMRPRAVAALGGWLVLVHALDVAWLVLPEAPARPLDVARFAAVALVIAVFGAWRAARTPGATPHEIARALAYDSR